MTECPAGNSQTAGKIGKISFAAISRHSDNPSGVLRKVVRSVFSKKKSSIKRIFRAENCGNKKIRLSLHPQQGGLAQLARALAWHARGHQFDPGILHNPGKDGHKSILIFLSESVPCIHKYPPLSSCSDRAQTGRGTIRIRTKPRAGSARAKKTAIGRKKNAITSNTGQ